MSVKYVPVQWNKSKYYYDAIMLAGVALFLWIFVHLSPGLARPRARDQPPDPQRPRIRGLRLCDAERDPCHRALSRLDRRFLPLLYNRRHFGVMTLFVAITHVGYVMGWYYAFSPIDPYEALLSMNTSFGQVSGFPFEVFGIFALISLLILATTSHDFWMKFLTPPIWKRLHYLIYPAYAAVVAHVAFGILQDQRDHTLTAVILGSAAVVAVLHVVAAVKELTGGDPAGIASAKGWVRVAGAREFEDGFAKVVKLPGGDRVAVFRMGETLSAISNACAHQNGPLGRGQDHRLPRDLPMARVSI